MTTIVKETGAARKKSAVAALTLGALGVVYGDIGTSPLYAFREALTQAGPGVSAPEIIGVLSLAIWALIIVVTFKYILFLTRADNQGEGGVLSLMALAQRATEGRWPIVLALGATGAALFFGDAIITPALSVLSAVEGLKTVPGVGPAMSLPIILGLTLAILVALFGLQSRGTASLAGLFGPVCALWFAALAVLGLLHIADAPQILLAFNPLYGARFIAAHGTVGLFVLGAVFLTVTGAEALFADMGHFGRLPIQIGWLGFVWPSLTLNYLGQGALALKALAAAEAAGKPFANADWFFLMAPEALRAPLVILATLATIIASQAVITGAYSLAQQAIALGLFPRMTIRQTSADQRGQIYMPAINWLLLAGVLLLVFGFKTSSSMAAAYGIAVTGTMVVTTLLAFIVAWRLWKWEPVWTAVLFLPFLAIDLIFFGANILRVVEGGWVPLLIGFAVVALIAIWRRGRAVALRRGADQGIAMAELAPALAKRPPARVEGTAVYLTEDKDRAPSALLHNLKHNKVLHERNILLTVTAAQAPHVAPAERLRKWDLPGGFVAARLTHGYMDRVDVPSDLGASSLLSGPGGASFFVGRNAIRAATQPAMPLIPLIIFRFLHRNAADPTAFFGIPANRVVELGSQIEL